MNADDARPGICAEEGGYTRYEWRVSRAESPRSAAQSETCVLKDDLLDPTRRFRAALR
jgi:hypothetical protein